MMRNLISEEMANFPAVLNHILGIVFIIIIFALAYAYLKPHQLHKRRLVSTLLLKVSYLFYLLVLLIIVYLSALVRGGLENVFFGIEFFAFLIVLFVPNIGIFALGDCNPRDVFCVKNAHEVFRSIKRGLFTDSNWFPNCNFVS